MKFRCCLVVLFIAILCAFTITSGDAARTRTRPTRPPPPQKEVEAENESEKLNNNEEDVTEINKKQIRRGHYSRRPVNNKKEEEPCKECDKNTRGKISAHARDSNEAEKLNNKEENVTEIKRGHYSRRPINNKKEEEPCEEDDKNDVPNKITHDEIAAPARDSNDIFLLTVLFRHGHRTPDKLYPTYPNQDENFFPYGFGELTNQGKKREFDIGRSLRNRYNHFLGDLVLTDTLVARSSDFGRTKRSLLLVLAGLYPPKGPLVWESGFNWQPIPTSYYPLTQDKYFFGSYCTRTEELIEEYKNSIEYQTTYNKFIDAFKFMTEKTGENVTEYKHAMRYFFNFKSMLDMGLDLPDWAPYVYPKTLEELSIMMYMTNTATVEITKYSAGFLVREMLKEMKEKIDGVIPAGRKIHLWSGHELNVAYVLRLLGVYYNHAPSFGAYITFELHKQNGNYGIRILYENYEGRNPRTLVLPGCTEICPFEKFVSLIEYKLPTEENVCDKVNV